MIENIATSIMLTLLTCLVHTVASKIILTRLTNWTTKAHSIRKLLRIDFTVMVLIMAVLLEVLIWSIVYLRIDAVKNIEEAVYFSLVTYSTLGYGDIVISETYRLIAAFQAALGVIMFGWSTALLIASLQKNYIDK